MASNILENYLIESLNLKREFTISFLTHPKESRFKNLFDNIKIKKKRKTMKVIPKNVMLGLDKRTSIIIKNIPDAIKN